MSIVEACCRTPLGAYINTPLQRSSHAPKALGWEPKVSFEEMVKMMVDADMQRLGTVK
jgi:GDP-D-mannose dehydratase